MIRAEHVLVIGIKFASAFNFVRKETKYKSPLCPNAVDNAYPFKLARKENRNQQWNEEDEKKQKEAKRTPNGMNDADCSHLNLFTSRTQEAWGSGSTPSDDHRCTGSHSHQSNRPLQVEFGHPSSTPRRGQHN